MRLFTKRQTKIALALSLCTIIPATFVVFQKSIVSGSKGVKPNSDLQEWFDSVTDGDDNSVSIDLGDRAGAGGTEDDEKLCVTFLSMALNKYPKAKKIVINWQYVIAMGVDESTLEYNRQGNTLTEYYEGRGKKFAQIGTPFTGVTESMIHSAAEQHDSYSNIEKYR